MDKITKDEAEADRVALGRAFREGKEALHGNGWEECPHKEGTPLYKAWMRGYWREWERFYNE